MFKICIFLFFERPKEEANVETIFEESVPIAAEIRNVVEAINNEHQKAEVPKEEPKKEEDSKEKIFVRPRFVKVLLFLSQQ